MVMQPFVHHAAHQRLNLLYVIFAIFLCIMLTACTGKENDLDHRSGHLGKTDIPAHDAPAKAEAIDDSRTGNMQDHEKTSNPSRSTERTSGYPGHLPNVFEGGPRFPVPVLGFNYYMIDEPNVDYLKCEYDVWDVTYDVGNESEWFTAALRQIQAAGSDAFPPIRWIAVVINNQAEHKGASTFEKSYKAGIIVEASAVFDFTQTMDDVVARAVVDHHPFKYDTTQPTPGAQQRWLIVEEHAKTHKK